MERDREKVAIERKLALCRQLAIHFKNGPTVEHVREVEADLLAALRTLDQPARQ